MKTIGVYQLQLSCSLIEVLLGEQTSKTATAELDLMYLR